MVLGSNNRVLFPLSLRSSLVQLMNGVSSYDNASTSITSSSLVSIILIPNVINISFFR